MPLQRFSMMLPHKNVFHAHTVRTMWTKFNEGITNRWHAEAKPCGKCKQEKERKAITEREREMVLYFQQELNGSDPDLADQQPASDAALHCTLLQNIVICLLSGSVMEVARERTKGRK